MENYDSDYSIRLAQLEAMGGDMTKEYDSVYEIDLEILKLTEEGGGGSAIKDVDALPDAAENKDKFVRLSTDGKLYAPVVSSSTTNKLPDTQQIDKAYLYWTADSIYHYKGGCILHCSDGEINGYLWYQEDDYFCITYDNAETVNESSHVINSEDVFATITDGIISTDFSKDDVVDNEDALISFGINAIPATYNAPEEAQIGNATFNDGTLGLDAVYSGEEVEYNDEVWYEWTTDIEGYYYISNKKASEIYGNFESYWLSDTILLGFDGNDYVDLTVEDIQNISIKQLNASDSEQVDNATLYSEGFDDNFKYTGKQYTLQLTTSDDEIETTTVYEWVNTDGDYYQVTFDEPYSIYSSSVLLLDYESYMDDKDDTTIYFSDYSSIDEIKDDASDVQVVSIVKYQRTQNNYKWEELIPDEIRISTSGDITVDGNGKINGVQNLSFGDYDVDSLKTLLGEVNELKTDIALVMPVGGMDTTFSCKGEMSMLTLSMGGEEMPMLLITFPFLNMSVQKMDKLTIYYDYTLSMWYIESLIDTLS